MDPAIISAGADVVAASAAVGALVMQRRQRVLDAWTERVARLSNMDASALTAVAVQDERIVDLVGAAAELAVRATLDEKRWLLARVAAAGLRGDLNCAQIDAVPIFLRTVDALEPPHVRLLALVGRPRRGQGQLSEIVVTGSLEVDEILTYWPEVEPVLTPLLAVLEREGLVTISGGRWDDPERVDLTDYGERFLRFLPGADTKADAP